MVTHGKYSIIEIKRFLGVTKFYQRYLWDFTNKVTSMCKLFKMDEIIHDVFTNVNCA
jgi:hypothetical protein